MDFHTETMHCHTEKCSHAENIFFPAEICAFLQKNLGLWGAHGRKPQEIAGGLQAQESRTLANFHKICTAPWHDNWVLMDHALVAETIGMIHTFVRIVLIKTRRGEEPKYSNMLAISVAIWRGAECPAIENSWQNIQQRCRVVPSVKCQENSRRPEPETPNSLSIGAICLTA